MKNYLLLIILGFCIKSTFGQMYYAGTTYQSYEDFSPDTLLNYVVTPYTNETLGFDLFDDSSNDLIITAHGSVSGGDTSAYIKITSTNFNVSILFGRWDSVYVLGNASWNVTKIAKPLIVTEPIDAPDAIWDNTTLYLTDQSVKDGTQKNVIDWVGTDEYLGIKYENNNSISYGWIRLKCPGEDSCYVKDLSFSQLIIGVREVRDNNFTLFPNPSSHSFYLKNINSSSFDFSKFVFTNMYGQAVKYNYEMVGTDIKIIPDSKLPEGCYLFQCVSENHIFSKKIIKSNE